MEPKKINKATPIYPLAVEEKRMFQLLGYAIKNGLVESEAEYWEKIRFPRTSISNVRKGKQNFTREQIKFACLLTGANANWVLDIESQQFREKGKKKTEIQQLREAVAAVEQALTKKKIPQRPEMLN